MLKDITLGQYYPGNSIIHKLDPRTKIILTFLFMILIFAVDSFLGYIGIITLFIIMVYISKIPFMYILKGIKPVLLFIIFAFLINLFFTDGRVIFRIHFIRITYEGLIIGIKMMTRLSLLILGTSFLTLTCTPLNLTDAIENIFNPLKRIKLPVHEFALMMSIALRFIPTLIMEAEKIKKAQMARGADFESGNIVKRAKSMIPILVPLFISAWKRAQELAYAMDARCYNGGIGKTRMNKLKYKKQDLWGIIFFIISSVIILVVNKI